MMVVKIIINNKKLNFKSELLKIYKNNDRIINFSVMYIITVIIVIILTSPYILSVLF